MTEGRGRENGSLGSQLEALGEGDVEGRQGVGRVHEAFAVERLRWRIEGERVVYRLAKPRPDGTQHIELDGNELLDRLAALIPPSRRHRNR